MGHVSALNSLDMINVDYGTREKDTQCSVNGSVFNKTC